MSALTNRYEDDDASHLPPGMKRVGYDADTGRYTFREGDDLWLGQPGSFYGGELRWAGKAPDVGTGDEDADSICTEHTSNESEPKTREKPSRKDIHEAASSVYESPQEDTHGLWGVPAVSISATGAKPPDTPKDDSQNIQRTKIFKKVAKSTMNALRVANWRSSNNSREGTNT